MKVLTNPLEGALTTYIGPDASASTAEILNYQKTGTAGYWWAQQQKMYCSHSIVQPHVTLEAVSTLMTVQHSSHVFSAKVVLIVCPGSW